LRLPVGFAASAASTISAALLLSSTFDDLADDAREAAMQLLQRAGIGDDESIIAIGDPVDETNRLVAEHEAMLVIVGSHRRGTFSSALIGSVSRELARHGSCPVLVAARRGRTCAYVTHAQAIGAPTARVTSPR
jgi:nucleotide-binding universal stress UspA family protein